MQPKTFFARFRTQTAEVKGQGEYLRPGPVRIDAFSTDSASRILLAVLFITLVFPLMAIAAPPGSDSSPI